MNREELERVIEARCGFNVELSDYDPKNGEFVLSARTSWNLKEKFSGNVSSSLEETINCANEFAEER